MLQGYSRPRGASCCTTAALGRPRRAPRRWCPSCSVTSGPCSRSRWPCAPAAPALPILPLLVVLSVVSASCVARARRVCWSWYPRRVRRSSTVWVALCAVCACAPGASVLAVLGPRTPWLVHHVAVLVVAAALLVAVPCSPLAGVPAGPGSVLRGRVGRCRTSRSWTRPLSPLPTLHRLRRAASLENVHDKLLLHRARRIRRAVACDWSPSTVRRPRVGCPQQHDGGRPARTPFLRSTLGRQLDVRAAAVRVRGVGETRLHAAPGCPLVGLADRRSSFDCFAVPLRDSVTSCATTWPPRRCPAHWAFGRARPLRVHLGGAWPRSADAGRCAAWPGHSSAVRAAVGSTRFLTRPCLTSEPAPMQQGLRLSPATCASSGRYSDGAVPGEQQYKAATTSIARRRVPARPPRPSVTTSSTPPPWPCSPTGSAYPRGWWWAPCCRASGKVRGADIHAWVELRVLDGSWRTLPTKAFMSRTPVPPTPGASRGRAASGGHAADPERPQPPSSSRPVHQAAGPVTMPGSDDRRTPAPAVAARCSCFSWSCRITKGAPSTAASPARTARGPDRRWRGPSSSTMRVTSGVPVRPHASRPAQARVMALPGARPSRGRPTTASSPPASPPTPPWTALLGPGDGRAPSPAGGASAIPASAGRPSTRSRCGGTGGSDAPPINGCAATLGNLDPRPNVGSFCGASRLPGQR